MVSGTRCIRALKHTGAHRDDDGRTWGADECAARAPDADEQITPQEFRANVDAFIEKNKAYLTTDAKKRLEELAVKPRTVKK